jgi:uncharacterized membrane protein
MLAYYESIYLFHVLIVGPLLVYVGYYKGKVDSKILDTVAVLGAIVIVYHGYKLFLSRRAASKVVVV